MPRIGRATGIGHIIDEPFGSFSSLWGGVTEESDGSDEAQLDVLPILRRHRSVATTIYPSQPITPDGSPTATWQPRRRRCAQAGI